MSLKSKHIFTLSLLLVICLSFSAALVAGQMDSETDIADIMREKNSPATSSEYIFSDTDDIVTEYNATVKANRTIELGYYGIVIVTDLIEFNVVGNESIIYLNYSIPNINADHITHASFRIANATIANLKHENATRTYTYSQGLNYSTYRVPFNTSLGRIGQDALYYIRARLEFSAPFEVGIENNEQVIFYEELLYPLVNNVPLINGTTVLTKQSGGDIFLEDDTHVLTPQEYLVSNASTGQLAWENFTRVSFNTSQNYEDDLIINTWLSSVSTTGGEEEGVTASTILFKSISAYRKVEIDPYGIVKITEKQTLMYIGPDRPATQPLTSYRGYALNAFQLTLEPNTTVLSLDDQIGHLNVRYQLNDEGVVYEPGSYNLIESAIYPGYQVLTVYPRYALAQNETMEYEIVYTVPIDQLLYREENSVRYSLGLYPTSIFNWTVEELTLDVYLPRGAVYTTSNYSSADPYQAMEFNYRREFKIGLLGFKRVVSFKTTDLSTLDNLTFNIDFTYTKFNLWIIFFLQATAVAVLIGLYITIRWFSRKTQAATGDVVEEFIPVDDIKRFVKVYEEKLSIQERLLQTKKKVRAKKLKVREGKQMIETLESRQRKTEEELRTAKNALAKHGGRYKEAVQEIEINERKLIEEQRNQRILQQEYRTKKNLTREAYSKMFRDRQKNIEKLRNDIDGRLVSLRLLIE